MPLLDLRLLGSAMDLLLRPEQAARNARGAAAEASDGSRHRRQIDREVTALADDTARPPEVARPIHR